LVVKHNQNVTIPLVCKKIVLFLVQVRKYLKHYLMMSPILLLVFI